MDILSSRYAEAILRFALGLGKGDVLSINTEADNLDFAHSVARLAREITGNGSFIQTIENGKVVSSDEVFTDFPISAKPTALLYIPVYKEYGDPGEKDLDPAAIQRFRHLSDPLGNPAPSIAFASAPAPSDAWGSAIEEDGDSALPAAAISAIIGRGGQRTDICRKRGRSLYSAQRAPLFGKTVSENRVRSSTLPLRWQRQWESLIPPATGVH